MNRQISQETLRFSSSNVLESCISNTLASVNTFSKVHVFQLVDRNEKFVIPSSAFIAPVNPFSHVLLFLNLPVNHRERLGNTKTFISPVLLSTIQKESECFPLLLLVCQKGQRAC